jgi:hypothetical protein
MLLFSSFLMCGLAAAAFLSYCGRVADDSQSHSGGGNKAATHVNKPMAKHITDQHYDERLAWCHACFEFRAGGTVPTVVSAAWLKKLPAVGDPSVPASGILQYLVGG